MADNRYDVIIIGGGAIGLAAAYYAAKRGKKLLVLEQYEFFNGRSASAGNSRQTRVQYNDTFMSKLVLQSMPLWRDLEKHSTVPLFHNVGCLWFGDPDFAGTEGQIAQCRAVMDEMDVPYEDLGAREIEDRFPFRNLPDSTDGFFQPDGGALNVNATLAALYDEAQRADGAELKSHHPVEGIESHADGVTVHTAGGSYSADKLIVTPGPFINDVTSSLGFSIDIIIWEMVSAYFRKSLSTVKYPTWITFQEQVDDDPGLYFGFPELDFTYPGYIRVASSHPVRVIKSMSERNPVPDAKHLELCSRWVRDKMVGLDPEICFPSSCVSPLISADNLTVEQELVLDFAPEFVPHRDNIVIYTAGWAFKFVPLVGKACADLAFDGQTEYDISHFTINDRIMSRS